MLFRNVVYVLSFCLLFSSSYARELNINDNYKCSFLGSMGEIPNPEDPSEQSFDVISYDIHLDLTKAPSAEMTGLSSVSLSWTDDNPGNLFYFHLQDLNVDSVFFEDELTEFKAVGEQENGTAAYSVPRVGSSTFSEINIYYSGTMTDELGNGTWGGVHSEPQYLYGMGVGFLNNYVSATRHWIACYDHPSDKAIFNITAEIPKDYEFVSNGLETNRNESESTKIVSWSHNFQMSSYLSTFAVGAYEEVKFDPFEGKNYQISVYSPDYLIQKSKTAFAELPSMISLFDSLFTPFPFERMGYVLTKVGAMEHQTMVSFPTSKISTSPTSISTEYTIVHELAHQWFGDYVTCLDFRDAWLSEGFAVFCEALFVEHKYGKENYYKFLKGKSNGYINNDSKADGIQSLYNFNRKEASNYPQTIYKKGGVVLAMLRENLGDDVFFSAIKSYLNEHKYANACSENLKNTFLNNVKDENKNKIIDFFDEWIYGKGWVKLNVEIRPSILDTTLTEILVKQSQQEDWGIKNNLNLILKYRKSDDTWDEINFNLNKEISLEINEQISDKLNSVQLVYDENSVGLVEIVELKNYTSIKNDNSEEIILYPNPSSNVLKIGVESVIKGFIRIYDINGNVVLKQRMNNNNEINIETLDSGIYVFNARINDKIINNKFQIKR
jgi:aminopeptidase N